MRMVRSDKYSWKRRLAPYLKNPQVLGVILIALVIPFTYYVVSQQTRTRQDAASPAASGSFIKWQPVTLSFTGPIASEADSSPNPFLDYRLQVSLTTPSGKTVNVPGYFDGDGNGGVSGNVWRIKFTPDEVGIWNYQAAFRQGSQVAISLDPNAGTATAFNGESGSFTVTERDQNAPGFLKYGLLEYVGGFYLKHREGPYFIKGGTDSPEGFLGYIGFDNTHSGTYGIRQYTNHISDWQDGDPDWGDGKGKGIIGALNYLSSVNANSFYFLTMNIGGDSKDTWPFVGPIEKAGSASNDNLHYDVSKLAQWDMVFSHAQKKGILLHFVLGEGETRNKEELDNATLGVERKLYYRELISRFGYHNALQWNLMEEYNGGGGINIGATKVKEFAQYIQDVDPYNHPITVHNWDDPDTAWTQLLGDSRFSLTSFQYYQENLGRGAETEEWRNKTRSAGRPLPINMDEFIPTTSTNAISQRKNIVWPNYLSGGHLEYILAGPGAEEKTVENFRDFDVHWNYSWYARKFLLENMPFWEMEPNDGLLTGEATGAGAGHVFEKPGSVYAIYLPDGNPSGTLSLSGASGSFTKKWYNPRSGQFEGSVTTVSGGTNLALGTPPSSPDEDWAVLITNTQQNSTPTPTASQQTNAFIESNGQLTIEAESYASKFPSTFASYQTVHTWVDKTDITGFSGNGFLQYLPDERGENGAGPSSPRDASGAEMRFPIKISTPGTYTVWVRGNSLGGESNGVHVGVDGQLAGTEAGASNMSGFRPHNEWIWEKGRKDGYVLPATLNLTAGYHTLNIWGRDDAFRIDKIHLTQSNSTPSGTGPDESSRENTNNTPTNTPTPTTQPPIGGTTEPTTTLALSPATASKITGTTTTTNVTINTQNLVTNADLILTFNPSVMEVTNVALGTYLSGAEEVTKSIDNTTGKVLYSFYTDNANAKSGTGTLATITWRAKAAGTSTVTFDPATTIVYGTGTGNTIASGGLSSATYTISGATVPTATPTTTTSTNSVKSFMLINSTTHADIVPLTYGVTVDLATIPGKKFNVRANTEPSSVGSVVFEKNGVTYSTENSAPYELEGDNGSWTPALGTHTIKATPFTQSQGSGTAGTPLQITIQVIDSSTSITSTPTQPTATNTPVPPTSTPVAASCTIGSASWNLSSVDEGTLVTLRSTVTGTGCEGKQVSFKVRENDSILEGGLDEDANTQPAAAVVSGSTATTTWIAEWQNDCNGLCNSPEYYFNATLAGGNTVRSADPLLSVQKTETAVTLKLKLPYLSESQDLLNSTVTIRNTQTNTDVSKTVTLVPGTNNTYTATLQTVLIPGEYAMVVKRHQFLAKRFTFTVGSTAPNLDFSSTPLVGGDINNDNVINTLDLGKVIEEYSPQADTTAVADLTRDKRINALDLGVVIENYFKQGETL